MITINDKTCDVITNICWDTDCNDCPFISDEGICRLRDSNDNPPYKWGEIASE